VFSMIALLAFSGQMALADEAQSPAAQPVQQDQQVQADQAQQPTVAAPAETPPAPPATPPAPPNELLNSDDMGQVQADEGQWVYTAQYGWVWMPYGDAYTQVSPDGTVATTYVYEPDVGWLWVLAPWVLGWGPVPYWGVPGVIHLGWHAHPWFHRGAYWGRSYYGGHRIPGSRHGGYWIRHQGRSGHAYRSRGPAGGRPRMRSARPEGGRSSFGRGGFREHGGGFHGHGRRG